MSRLKRLLHASAPNTRNTQQIPMQACKAVAQNVHTTQQEALDQAFDERAAIMEFDGGLPRTEAEREGWALVLKKQAVKGRRSKSSATSVPLTPTDAHATPDHDVQSKNRE